MSIPRRHVTRLLIVDDHPLVRIGLRAQLSDGGEFRVVGEAASIDQAVALYGRLKPDLVMLDLNLIDGSGVDACRRLLEMDEAAKVLVMTLYDDAETVRSAIAAGAHGFLPKDSRRETICEAVRTVAAGRVYLHPCLVSTVLDCMRNSERPVRREGLELLSPQERRILPLLAEGRTNKEIGSALGLSEKTVKNYLARMFTKLCIASRTEAVTLYVRSHLNVPSACFSRSA
jgi:DNA-binding NarL/FixJ family response regulator